MILMCSGRCDIVAFYTDWFMKRYQEGFVDVRNPFYPSKVSRIFFKDVDLILFCTKNPIPMVERLKEIKIPILFHVTLTPYKKDTEPNVPPKKEIISAIRKISRIVGIENLYVRYDPIFLSEKYPLSYHLKAFRTLCELLDGSVRHFIISFLDDYQNVRKNKDLLKVIPFTQKDYEQIGLSFSESAKAHHMTVQTCFEEENLVQYGFIKADCLGKELAQRLTGKTNFKRSRVRKEMKCHCVEMADIGAYNTCRHLCLYCYANYEERKVQENCLRHEEDSTMLIGHLEKEDTVVVRK